jgi:hypothetical protein
MLTVALVKLEDEFNATDEDDLYYGHCEPEEGEPEEWSLTDEGVERLVVSLGTKSVVIFEEDGEIIVEELEPEQHLTLIKGGKSDA